MMNDEDIKPEFCQSTVICTGCWDYDERPDRHKYNHSIAVGEPVYWRRTCYEVPEYDAYCPPCWERYLEDQRLMSQVLDEDEVD